MLRKTTSSILVSALILSLGVASASAKPVSDPDDKSNEVETRSNVNSAAKSETTSGPKSNEKLRSDVERLLSEARAGKIVPPERRQMKPPKSNNLSKGAKIAIGVGIAVVVIAIIVKYQRDHLFDNLRLSN